MILYNAKTIHNGFRITKFDDNLNVESIYPLDKSDRYGFVCGCPSWPRKSHCKHIDMLEKFRWREYVDTEWFYNADVGEWHRPVKSLAVGSTPFPSEAEAWSTILGEKIDAVHDGVLIKNSSSGPDPVPLPGPEAAEAPTPRASAVSLRRQI